MSIAVVCKPLLPCCCSIKSIANIEIETNNLKKQLRQAVRKCTVAQNSVLASTSCTSKLPVETARWPLKIKTKNIHLILPVGNEDDESCRHSPHIDTKHSRFARSLNCVKICVIASKWSGC